tara:strand:+ start:42724 stop:43344 length:621 start_codon:yes stop_codon:yes gene_type:complete
MLSFFTQIEPLIHKYGMTGLFFDVFLEALGMPLPGETLVIAASGLAALGQLNIYSVAATCFAAAVLGDNVGYLIGRKLGRPVIVHYGSRIGITHERLLQVENVLHKHGSLIVALARFVVVLRQLNGIAAGTAGMHWLKFLIANAVGAALWVGLWTSLAYHFGKDIAVLPQLLHHLSLTAMVIMAALILSLVCLAFGLWKHKTRKAA